MKSKPVLIVLVLLVVAVAAVLAFQGGDGALPPAAPDSAAAEAARSAAPDRGHGGAATADAAQDDATRAAGHQRVEVVDTGRGATEGAAGSGGEARITGRLVDSQGRARAGAELEWRSWRNPDGVDFYFPGDRDERPATKLTIGPDGGFTFEMPRDHTATLSLPSSELRFADSARPIHGREGNQDLGDLVVVQSAVLAGVVSDERGVPVAGVTVSALSGGIGFGGMSRATTAADGRFRLGKLSPGQWTLRTASAQFMPALHEVTVQEADLVEDIVLTVRPGKGIAGQVVDDLGRPVEGMRVGAKRSEARGGIDIERFSDDEATTTDANGMFALFGLEGETATVRAFGGEHTAAVAPNVRIGTGNLVLRVDRSGTVTGVLLTTDGKPIAGSRVHARTAARADEPDAQGIESLLPDRLQSATTAADGTFRIERVRPGDVVVEAAGDSHLPAKSEGIRLAPGRVVDGVRLVAATGASVTATVLDDRGQPVAGAEVSARRPSSGGPRNGEFFARSVEADGGEVRVFGDGRALGTAVTDAEGRATIRGLPATTLAVTASHVDFADSAPVSLPLLANGAVEVQLTLRVPGWVDLTATQAGSNAPVVGARYSVRCLDPGADERKGGSTDDAGKALVGPLAPGNYTAELVRTDEGMNLGGARVVLGGADPAIEGSRTNFTVAAGKTTPVVLIRPVLARVFGTVVGADGPVAACHIELQKRATGMPSIPGMGGGRSTTTAADGTFAIDDVEPGSYQVEYGRIEQLVKAEVELNVAPGTPEHRLDLALRTGTVRVQAWSTTTGGPIAGAEVELSRSRDAGADAEEPRERQMVMVSVISTGSDAGDSTMMTFGSRKAKTGADGWAEIDDVPVGSYEARVSHPKYSPATQSGVAVAELQTTDVGRVMLSQAGRIRGKVVQADGSPAQMGLVFHRPLDGREGQPTMAMGGSFELGELAPGRYVLRAQALQMGPGAAGPAGAARFGPEVEVEVLGGETTPVELRLPAN